MKQAGFTLTELIVVAAVGITLLMAVLNLTTDFMRSQNTSEKVHDVLVASETVVNQLARDMRESDSLILGPTTFIIRNTKADPDIEYTYLLMGKSTVPETYDLYRNGTSILPSDVVLAGTLPILENVSLTEDSPFPLVNVKLTLEHTSKQGSKVIHETNTILTFRVRERML